MKYNIYSKPYKYVYLHKYSSYFYQQNIYIILFNILNS